MNDLSAPQESNDPLPVTEQALDSIENANDSEDGGLWKGGKARKALPEAISAKFISVGDSVFYAKNTDSIAFTDKGNKLETEKNSKALASDFIAIAQDRGWSKVKVSGTQEFRSAAWVEAQKKGLVVRGYSPVDTDLAALQKHRQDLALARDKANAFLNQKKEDVIEKYPDMIKAYALLSASEKFSDKNFEADDQVKFRLMMKTAIASQVGVMAKIPNIRANLQNNVHKKMSQDAKKTAGHVKVERDDDHEQIVLDR